MFYRIRDFPNVLNQSLIWIQLNYLCQADMETILKKCSELGPIVCPARNRNKEFKGNCQISRRKNIQPREISNTE